MENGHNENKIKINPIVAVFIIFQIIFILAIVISAPKLFQDNEIGAGDYDKQPKVTIQDLKTVLSGHPEKADAIERSLLDIIQNNTNDVNLKSSVATMRDLKEIYFDHENLHHLSFIADIPDLSQSYQIFYEYSDDENNPYLSQNDTIIPLCLSEYETKLYPEFVCKDLYEQTTRNAIVAKYLSYFNFDYFSAYIDLSDIFEIVINPISDNVSDVESSSYINTIKDNISSLGISAEIFNYHIVQPEDLNYIIEE